jgi:hypothetical protein
VHFNLSKEKKDNPSKIILDTILLLFYIVSPAKKVLSILFFVLRETEE